MITTFAAVLLLFSNREISGASLSHWIVDGNPGYNVPKQSLVPECKPNQMNSHTQDPGDYKHAGTNIGVTCCNDKGFGSRPDCETGRELTYDEAFNLCESKGLRICTLKETAAGVGAGKGCQYDHTMVWTSDPCNLPSHWIVDGNPGYNVPKQLSLVPECKPNYMSSHTQDPGNYKHAGTNIGVTCCNDEGVGSRPDCETGRELTYDEALYLCESKGLRICTMEETAAGVGAGKGCQYDHTMVWTSDSCTELCYGSGYVCKDCGECCNGYTWDWWSIRFVCK